MRSDHQRLLRAAGFRDITELDVTPAFAATAAAWLAETEPTLRSSPGWNHPAPSSSDRPTGAACWPPSPGLRRALLLARTA